jgi:glyoxylase I family protein
MAIIPKTPGIHHIGLRSMDFNVTKNFYCDIICFPLVVDKPDLIIFAAASVFIAFKKRIQGIKNILFSVHLKWGLTILQ